MLRVNQDYRRDEIKKLYEMNLVIFNKMSNNVFMAKRLSLSN